jgi:hypothetical protein
MPSPFPGMDPWLEDPALFPDLHETLIACFREALTDRLPRPYYAALGTRLYVEESDRHIEPDIDLLIPKKRPKKPAGGRGGVAVAERTARPLTIRVSSDNVKEAFIEIRHATGDRLVTSVEVLSLSNKTKGSEGRKQYRRKRKELRQGRVNVVEIDLLRAGEPTTLPPLGRVRRMFGQPFDYHVCVWRPHRASAREVYPVPLDDLLPVVAIPLLKGDADVSVDLQQVFARCYAVGRFDLRAKYAKPPTPPLASEQQAWVDTILKTMEATP